MTLITMPDASYQGTTLPGGWTTTAPTAAFNVADERMRDLVRVLKRYGASHAVAEAEALKRVEAFWTSAWRTGVMKPVARWAHIYKQETGSLAGFDAATLARVWVPGMFAGRQPHGNLDVKALREEMRKNG